MDCNTYECMDAGTENCPCYLAVTGDCLTCSRLQGKDYCDCNWKGVCIYNEFMQGNGRINNPRKEFSAPIVSKKMYLDDLVVFQLEVGKGFAIKASKPGSFVFIRSREGNRFYDLPISVMRADVEKGIIHIAVKIIALKTKALLEETEAFILRGVYRNGVLGLKPFLEQGKKKQPVLLVAKGVGIAPAVLIAESLQELCPVDFIIDKEKISTELLEDYLHKENGTVRYITLSDQDQQKELAQLLTRKEYGAVAVLSSDYFIKLIGDIAKEKLPEAAVAFSNNYHLCCGEGICGSCVAMGADGTELKMCKCQNPHL